METTLAPKNDKKQFWRDMLLLFVFALLVRFAAAWPQQQPNYMDAAYSYVNAVNLAQGRGFVEDFVWNYLGNPGQPPHPSHLYWMPLTSIMAGLGMAVGGIGYRAAQAPFVLLSALLAPISYYTAVVLSGRRWLSWLAGLFAIFSGFYFPFWAAIDNFTPFAVTGSLALIFAWRGMVGSQQSAVSSQQSAVSGQRSAVGRPHSSRFTSHFSLLIIAGLFAGLAHLSRADGPLLLVTIVLATVLRSTFHVSRNPQHATRNTHRASLIAALLLGYLLVMTPWFVRNWQVAGTPFPTAGSQTIWLTTYDDLFSYGQALSPQTFFGQGIGPVLQGRWWALVTNLQTVLAVWGMIFLTPLAAIGLWHLRGHLLVRLAGLYALLLFAALTLLFAFPGARGGLFHSGAALLPFIYAAAVVGLDRSVDWAAARRQGWDAQVAKRVFGVGLVVFAVALSSFIYYQRVIKNNRWNSADAYYPAIAAWVSQQNPNAIVMIGNPPAYRYHGGGLSVVVPNENVDTLLRAARHYQVDYLILDQNRPAPLADIYNKPGAHPALSLVKTFGQNTGAPIYIFRVVSNR